MMMAGPSLLDSDLRTRPTTIQDAGPQASLGLHSLRLPWLEEGA